MPRRRASLPAPDALVRRSFVARITGVDVGQESLESATRAAVARRLNIDRRRFTHNGFHRSTGQESRVPGRAGGRRGGRADQALEGRQGRRRHPRADRAGEGEVQAFNHLDKSSTYPVDQALDDADPAGYDALVLPGGVANPDQLRTDERAIEFVQRSSPRASPSASSATVRGRSSRQTSCATASSPPGRPCRPTSATPAASGSTRKSSSTKASSRAASPMTCRRSARRSSRSSPRDATRSPSRRNPVLTQVFTLRRRARMG